MKNSTPPAVRRFNWPALLISFFVTGFGVFASIFIIELLLNVVTDSADLILYGIGYSCLTLGAVIVIGLLAGGMTWLVGGPARIEAAAGAFFATTCNALPALLIGDRYNVLGWWLLEGEWRYYPDLALAAIVPMIVGILCIIPLVALMAFIAAPSKPRTAQAAVLPEQADPLL